MKKLIIVAGATYLATRHWDKLSAKDQKKVQKQVQKRAADLGDKVIDLGYKVAQAIGRGIEEIDYRMAWKKLGR